MKSAEEIAREVLRQIPWHTGDNRLAVEIITEAIHAERKVLEEKEVELERIRNYCTLTYGFSHPEIKKCPHEMEVEAQAQVIERMREALNSIANAGGFTIYTNQSDWLGYIKSIAKKALLSLPAQSKEGEKPGAKGTGK